MYDINSQKKQGLAILRGDKGNHTVLLDNLGTCEASTPHTAQNQNLVFV